MFWEKYKSGGPASISAMGRIRASSQPPAVGQSSNNPSAAAPQIASTQSESGQCDPPTGSRLVDKIGCSFYHSILLEGPSRRMSTRRPASVAISGSNADQEDVYDAGKVWCLSTHLVYCHSSCIQRVASVQIVP